MNRVKLLILSPGIIRTGVTSGNISKIIGTAKDSFQQLSAI
jgi:hypothetical protein